MNILQKLLNELIQTTTVKGEHNEGQLNNSSQFNTKQLPLFLLTVDTIDWQVDNTRKFADDVEFEIDVLHTDTAKLLVVVDLILTKLWEHKFTFSDRIEHTSQTGVLTQDNVKYITLTFTISHIWFERQDAVKYTRKKLKQIIK